MADQLQETKQENFALLVLQKAIIAINQDLPQISSDLKDVIYEKMCNLCKADTENGVKVMYKCCLSINHPERRVSQTKLFFDKIVSTGHI